ncbi:MAG: Cas9 endonuclease PAM-interacting domain-containing protein, partial [Oscillospiraceae bacterium]
TRPNAVAEHFEKQGYKNAKIIKDDIKKYQKINYQGNERYIVGVDETINAKQLVLSREDVKIITLINNPYTINNVEPEQINRVIDNIIAKMESQYPYYAKVAQRLKANCDAVYKIEADKKAKFINEMLKITKASSAYGAFKKFEIPDLKDRMDRKGGKILQPEEIEFIDTSVTGLLETKSKIL